jgi:nicotinamide riboside kinase
MHGDAFIHSAVLRERLDDTLRLAEIRERTIYHADENRIAEVKQSFKSFVALCAEKEREMKVEVLIVANY